MPKKGQRRQDHLARRARSEGYHARSVYKLEGIDKKYEIFRSLQNRPVLDLGAAPGSWSQYAQTRGAVVVAVDLQELAIPQVECICGDFTDLSVITTITDRGPYDLVMSDAAPSTTGNRIVDTGRSEGLVESILASLDAWLAPGGSFVAKIFQGGGEQRFLSQLRVSFRKGAIYRPSAVRSESFETYLIGIGYGGTLGDDGRVRKVRKE